MPTDYLVKIHINSGVEEYVEFFRVHVAQENPTEENLIEEIYDCEDLEEIYGGIYEVGDAHVYVMHHCKIDEEDLEILQKYKVC